MATNRVGGLNVVLTATTGPFTKSMKKASSGVKKFGKDIGKITKQVAKYGAALGAVALGGMTLLVKSTLKSIDETSKLSTQLGISTEALSAYNLQADLTGTSMDAISGALKKMVKNLGDAQVGVGTATQGLDQLGIAMTDIQGLNTEQTFELIAGRISEIEDPAKRASAAAAIFGRKAQEIDIFLRQGAEGIQLAREQTEKFGTSLSAVDAKKIEMANDAMRTVGEAFQGFIQQVTIKLAPILTVIAQRLQAFGSTGNTVGKIMDKVINFIVEGIQFAIKAWNGFQIVLSLGEIAILTVGQAFLSMGNTVVKVVQTSRTVFGAFWDWLKAAGNNMVATFDLIWGALRRGINAVIVLIQKSIGSVLESAGKALQNVKGMGEIATDIQVAGGKLRNEGLRAERQSQLAFEKTKQTVAQVGEEATKAGAKLVAAFSGQGATGSEDIVAASAMLEQQKQDAITAIRRDSEDIRRNESLASDLQFEITAANEKAALLAEQETAKQQTILGFDTDTKAKLAESQLSHEEKIRKDQEASMSSQEKLWKSGLQGRLKVTSSVLGKLGGLMQSKSKKAFKIGKAAAISEAVVNTGLASIKAYQAMAGIPIVGPSLGIAAAIGVAASGKATVDGIRATQFGGGSVKTPTAPNIGGGGGGGNQQGALDALNNAQAAQGIGDSIDAATAGGIELVINADEEGAILDGRKVIDLINSAQADGALIQSVTLVGT